MEDLFSFIARQKDKVLGKAALTFSPAQALKDFGKNARSDRPMRFFLQGYQLANELEPEELANHIASYSVLDRKVVYEAAYGAYTSADLSSSGALDRTLKLMQTFPETLPSMFYGVGMGLSLLDASVAWTAADIENSWGWLALDGYGFGEYYFRWTKRLHRTAPEGLTSGGLRAFDEGAGRAIWFMCKCDPNSVREVVESFVPERRASLWVGLGMMAGLWGFSGKKNMQQLMRVAAANVSSFQMGVAYGLFFKTLSGELEDFNKDAGQVVCGIPAEEVVGMVADYYKGVELGDFNSFHNWRENVHSTFRQSAVLSR